MGAATDTDPNPKAPLVEGTADPLAALPPPRERQLTAPGIGAPGLAESPDRPAAAASDVTPVLPPRGPDAITHDENPAPPRVAMLLEGTPVPPEATEALLNGLITGENESYFHKAKPASESSGEAAVAYAAGPHVVTKANPTAAPQPAVMLRRSLELDIAGGPATPARVAPAAASPPPPAPASPLPQLPEVDRLRATAPSEMTMPLVVPLKGRSLDRWLAFLLAAALAGLAGIAMVRWLTPAVPEATAPAAGTASASPARTTATTPQLSRPPMPPAAPQAQPAASASEPVASDPVPPPLPTRAAAASVQPGASAPPPPRKNDVKRAL
jgi:S-DNA-T family DNA segregation ATPase FtsK/SpoIIIE